MCFNLFTPSVINSIGLIFDIIGAIMIFIFGIQPGLKNAIHTMEANAFISDPAKEKKYKDYKLKASIGILLIIVGFIFQLLSNFLK